ncbi:MAG: hypothetical protein AAF357_12035, partial [Verrucomicrobiota bacterium]
LQITDENGTRSFTPGQSAGLRSPALPGFFTVYQGDDILLDGAANFADIREADFTDALSRSDLTSASRKILEHSTISDPWWPLWVLAFLLLSISIWGVLSRSSGNESTLTPIDS